MESAAVVFMTKEKIVRTVFLVELALMVIAIPLLSQTPAPAKPSFEVVSIKPSAPANNGIRLVVPRGDRYRMIGVKLRLLLTQAYSLPAGQLQIIRGPSWIDTDRYDIEATADCSRGALPPEQLQLMIRSMLEDRFQLKTHMETRELPTYNLIVTKDGPKLKRSEDQTPPAIGAPLQACSPVNTTQAPSLPPPPAPGLLPRGRLTTIPNPNGFIMQGAAMPIANLASALETQFGRPVIDKTDIKGLYDFKFTFSPEGLQGTPLAPVPPAAVPRAISIQRDSGAWVETGIHERSCGSSGHRFRSEANRKLSGFYKSPIRPFPTCLCESACDFDEVQRYGVHAVTLASGGRAVVENVAQVRVA